MVKRLYFCCAYFASWPLFAAGALALNAVCAVLLLFPGRAGWGRPVRQAIRRLFQTWVGWLEFTGLVDFVWQTPGADPFPRGTVYVANHPSLLDATILLSRLPDAVCIFKPSVLRNPLLAPAAILAGYGAGNAGVDMVRGLASHLIAGQSILIFPEGTRTRPGVSMNEMKPGFALIADRAEAPVQVLILRASRDFLPCGHSWWRVPRFPSRYEVRAAGCLPPQPGRAVLETFSSVSRVFAAGLGSPP